MSETVPSPSMTTVRLVGGPDDWREQTLTHLTETDLAGPRDSLGAYLVSSLVPADHPDPGARAVYEPDVEPGSPRVWFFRGWSPFSPTGAELRTADHRQGVDVILDGDQIPTEWVTDAGDRYRVDRILGHWEATGENDLAPDWWHIRSASRDWELLAHPGHWEAGLLPRQDEDME